MKKKRIRQNLCRGCMPKFLLKMKLLSFFILVSAITTLAANSYSQQTKFNISFRSATVREVLQKIEDSSEFIFLYSEKSVDVDRKVNVNVTNQTVDVVLDQLFNGTKNFYEIRNRQISILEKGSTENSYLQIGTESSQQPKSISGKVTDSSGGSLPGVSVVVKGTTKGTITDANGNYILSNISENAILQFSFIGMKSQDGKVEGKTVLNVRLEEETIGIEEVVAIGYGTMNKQNVSTAISTIDAKKFADIPVMNISNALIGQASGVSLQQSSGGPGSSPTIRIRGNGSITSGNDPLYVIDGYPTTDASLLNSIQPSDIESVDILKDAASAAIYGSRAGNGVIIVTTKKGVRGKTNFTFDVTVGQESLSKKYELLGPEEYVEMAKEALTNQGKVIPSIFNSPEKWARTDWQDVIFRTAPYKNYQIGASGGNEKIKFSISGGFTDNQGILLNSYMKRYNLKVNVESQLNSWLKVGINVLPSYTERRKQNTSGSNTSSNNDGIIAEALSMPPILPVFKENGDYYIIYQDNTDKTIFNSQLCNPLNTLDANKEYYHTFQQAANAYIEIQPLKGLTLKTTLNSGVNNQKYDKYIEAFFAKSGNRTGNISTPDLAAITAERTNSTYLNIYWSNTANYNYTFKGKHDFNLLIGYDLAMQNNYSVTVTPRTDASTPIAFDNTTIKNVQGAVLKQGSSSSSEYVFDAMFSRFNYNYDGRYLLSASFRRDRSSRFGPDAHSGIFPSLSLGWNMKKELFLTKISYVSQLKLRSSYGETGNDQLSGSYPWISTIEKEYYVLGSSVNNRVIAYRPSGFSNEDLGWEKNKQFDAGLDLGFFDNRFNVSIDGYERNSNTILSASIPIINGKASTVIQNVGNVQNKGLEIALSSTNISKTLVWKTDFNISFNRNKIVKLGPGQNQLGNVAGGAYGGDWAQVIRNYVGRPMGDIYMYILEGTFNNADDLTKYPKLGTQAVGDLRFKDVSGPSGVPDGKITSDDMTLVGNYQPDFSFGFTNNFSYKGFDLNIILNGTYGGQIINSLARTISLGRVLDNSSIEARDRWRSESNTGSGRFQKAGTNNLGNDVGPNTRFLYDSKFLRISNITLGYSVPKSKIQKLAIDNARVFITAQNLYTFTKFPGYNPEGNMYGNNATSNGVEQGTYPLSRNISIGLSLKF